MESNQCVLCKHYRFNLQCSAFPEQIPEDILTGKFKHNKQHPKQDNDVLFTPLEPEQPDRKV